MSHMTTTGMNMGMNMNTSGGHMHHHGMTMTTASGHNHHHNHTMMPGMTMSGGHGGHNMGGSHNGHSMGGMDMDGMGMGGMMKMYFHIGVNEYLLFQALYTKDAGQMAAACVVFFVIGMLYEGLKFLREYLLRRANYEASVKASQSQEVIVKGGQNTVRAFDSNGVDLPKIQFGKERRVKSCGSMLTCSHFVQTVLHMLQVFISYCLMLIFMTYNVWLCLSVVLGAGAGYFMFGWRRAVVVDTSDHCN